MLKRTPFIEFHKALGAKLVDFAGFEMPVQYSSIIEEHLAVRRSVCVFDVTHMGEFIISGNDALNFLQKVTTNDVARLKPGRVQYSAMCYEDGGIIDDLLIYKMEKYFMLVVNASNLNKDLEWLQSNRFGDVQIKDVSDATALLAVQGPKSLAVLQKLTKVDLSKIEYYTFNSGILASVDMIISRTGYTGELGFELYFDASTDAANKVWNSIFEAGKEFGIAPIGLGARDTLRLEMGYCLYGNDIDKSTNPLEAGLGWITKLNKTDFVGKKALLKIKEEGLKRKLVGFTLPDRTLARHGYQIVHKGNNVGHVTSGSFSPILQRGIGMGYVVEELSSPGQVVSVMIRDKEVPGEIINLPFIREKK